MPQVVNDTNWLDKHAGLRRLYSKMRESLEELYDGHAQALFAFLLNLTRNEADTRDLLQEVFCKIARRRDLLDDARDTRAFLLRTAHNLALDLIRRRAARERKHDALAGESPAVFEPADDLDERRCREALAAALAELPEEQRAVIHLKLWEGLTFEAIAETLGIPPNTAASRYRYGIDKLRERLRPIYGELR